jgi:DNA-binding MarR family transcriptional regulator
MSQTLTFGQQLAFAGRTLTRGLHTTLAKNGMEPAQWYALMTLTTYGAMPVERLRGELAQAPATASIDELVEQRIIGIDGGVADVAPHGKAVFETAREAVKARTRELLGRFDPADIETTRRVLGELAEHAEVLPAA